MILRMHIRHLALLALISWTGAAGAQELRRATVWDLRLGQPIAAQPSPNEFRGFACGSNGGPPRLRLTGWNDFARSPAAPGRRPEGEGRVGELFIKQPGERPDPPQRRRALLRINFFRKPGQNAFNPQMSTQLTQGQFESSARLEVLDNGPL